MSRLLPPIHPGETIKEDILVPLHMSVNQLAKALAVDAARLNEIVRGRRGITADTALRLARYLGTTRRVTGSDFRPITSFASPRRRRSSRHDFDASRLKPNFHSASAPRGEPCSGPARRRRYNRRMLRRLILLLASAAMVFAQKRPFDVNALMELKRIGDPQISPDGRWVAFAVQTVDVAANKKPQQIWVVPLVGRRAAPDHARRRSQSARALVARFPAHRLHLRPRRLVADLADGPGRRQRQSRSPTSPPKPTACSFRPTARTCCSPAKSIPSAAPTMPATRRTSTPRRTARSARASTPNCSTATGTPGSPGAAAICWSSPCRAARPRISRPGTRDVPPFSLGGPDDYDISPDGTEVCYSMNADPVPATSTNADLYVVSIAGGESRQASRRPPGADSSPHYSPDGKYIAWRAQFRAGYESDRWRLLVLERATGKVTNLTETLDRWVNSFTWSPDSTGALLHHRRPRPAGHPVDFGHRRRGARRGQRRQRARRHAVDARRQDHGLHAADRHVAHRDLSRLFHRRRTGGAHAPQRRRR